MTAVVPLLGGPLLGAVTLAVLGRRASRGIRDGVTLVALSVTLAGLAWGLLEWKVMGRAVQLPMGLDILGLEEPAGRLIWTLAPVAVAVSFLVIAVRARSLLLVGLSAGQLLTGAIAAARELLDETPGRAGVAGLVVDPLAITLLTISVVVGGLIAVYALGYEPDHLAHRFLPAGRTSAFVAWLLVFIAAMNLLVLADDLRLLEIGWEVTTLCSFVLIGFDRDDVARIAARRALAYNLLGGVALAAAVALAGPGGSLSGLLADGGRVSPALPFVLAGCIVAAATKSALAPFHPWLLAAMVAAAPVSALLHASAMVKAGSYLLLRLASPIAADGLLGPLLVLVGGLTFAVTALMALRERDLKRILAYSTISTLGLIAAAAGLGSAAALSAGVLLLVFHALAKALAFLSVGALEQVGRTRDLEGLVGSLRTAPRLAGPLALAAAALALPPFGLVIAKWALLELGAGDIALIVLLAVGGAAYMVVWTKVVGRLLVRRARRAIQPADADVLPVREQVPVAVLGLASAVGLVVAAPIARAVADPAGQVAFGVDPGLAMGWSIALGRGTFSVPAVALLTGAALLAALAVGRRIRTTAPAPYLSGATMSGSTPSAFHGGLGRPVDARSGGFYWGAGGQAPSASAGPEPAAGPGIAPDAAGIVARSTTIVGWLLIVLIGLAAAVGTVAGGAAP